MEMDSILILKFQSVEHIDSITGGYIYYENRRYKDF